ncbi:hypothetical protein [Streptomyces microflavus]|uniref:hypothetical protein n=1 Tax=Streptomyces microflavus TaxID=1919 RepID=UPI002E3800C1|nr:hypothetical protein [Streptomyces microflavus]
MTATTREAPHHNTLTCYVKYQCRLPECIERYTKRNQERRATQADGTWGGLIDAEPVRQHLLKLHEAGISIYRVAELAGMDYKKVRIYTQHSYSYKEQRRRRITPRVAARLLALDINETTPAKVDPIGLRRRVQALAAIGWPRETVISRAGLSPRNACKIVDQPTVLASSMRAVSDVYDDLSCRNPLRSGVTRNSVSRTKNRAAANRWPTPKYWARFPGAIDDPHFTPEYKVTQAEILAEESRWLIETAGLTRTEAAERLGKHRSYIDRVLGQTDLKAAA